VLRCAPPPSFLYFSQLNFSFQKRKVNKVPEPVQLLCRCACSHVTPTPPFSLGTGSKYMADTSTHASGKKEDEAYIARINWNAGNEARGGK
jgi:hypothetical protein